MTEPVPPKVKRQISAEHRANIIRTASENARKVREFDRLLAMVDALLNHCDKDGGECHVCSQIVCPHKDPLHFHHDGCPSCETQGES
jgi:hypothetical protein